MLTLIEYMNLKERVLDAGYEKELLWAMNIEPVKNAVDFALEHAYVVCNSGMKQQIARVIYDKVRDVILAGGDATTVYGHKAKAGAINHVWANRDRLFAEYLAAEDKLEFCRSLPWIGSITCYHLAKNYGADDLAKPDRHLERIAGAEGTHALCARLSQLAHDKVAVVDTVIWRAANLGFI